MSEMNSRKNIWKVVAPLLLTLGLAGGVLIGRYLGQQTLSPEEQKLRAILGLIENEYVDEIDVDSVLEKSIPDIIAQLDPHSAYIPASELKGVTEDLEGSFSGVGVSFQIVNDSVQIIEVISGGPAEKVGIVNGDRIISANGVDLAVPGVSSDLVFKTLRGERGSKVKLKIKRSNSVRPLEFDVVRGEIPVNSVDCSYLIDKGIGYVRVNKFARTTYSEFVNALTDLRSKGAVRFVVDLRGNAGGYMDQAIMMANEFLPSGKTIVFTKGRRPENETIAVSDGNGGFQDSELTILTNEFSASASEIFAGAIQDNDRGLVIGLRTFGKGLVQNQTVLPDSSALRLTVARYYTPTGRSIQKEYVRGKDGKYDMEIADRYMHGEIYNADSIRNDKSKLFLTPNRRKVYGGGGITPDVFVAEDTVGITSYYISVVNKGLIQSYAAGVADRYRSLIKGSEDLHSLLRVLPRDNTLLESFVSYAVGKGVPARWYYINQSGELILRQIKAFIARDVLGYNAFIQMLNEDDPVVRKAVESLVNGKSPVVIWPDKPNARRNRRISGK